MNTNSATLDREESYPAGRNSTGRGRHAYPVSENSTGRGRHTRPSRLRRYVIGAGVAVVGGAAVVAGVLATSSPATAPAVQPAATATSHSSGTHTANPAVPSRPNVNPAVPSHPGSAS
jgi:hypothetical protein